MLAELVAAVEGGSVVTAVTIVDHPVLAHRLAQFRDRRTGSDTFRQLISEVSGLLAYEAFRDLGTHEVTVDTPVADAAPARRVAEVVLLVPILRAPGSAWCRPSRRLCR